MLCVNQPPEVKAALEEFLEDRTGFMVLAGDAGTGKTFAVSQLFRQIGFNPRTDTLMGIVQKTKRIEMITEHDLKNAWHAAIAEENSTRELEEDLKCVDVLIIDDLGTTVYTPGFHEFVFAIIDHRWANKRSLGTVVTTNLTENQLIDALGSRMVSRISSGKRFRLKGEDRRRLNEEELYGK